VITASNISKSYNQVKALTDVSFHINENELFGFIGPDGAGKTTLFRILTSLLIPNQGTATVAGLDVVKDYKALRLLLGYMPGRFSLYQDLSVEENLNFFATIFGTTVEENYSLIKDIYSHIEPFKTRQAGKLSGGMKQKLALSCALIHKPKVLILDEPTFGVDAVSRKEFWQMLKDLQKKGITIVVSTPYMDEASLCDRVALMQKGEIMVIDSPKNITSQFNKQILAIRSNNMYLLTHHLREYPNTNSVYIFGQYVHYTSTQNQVSKEELLKYLESKNHSDIEIIDAETTIEDCFMELMSNKQQ
jgi:ABC-2 type transport system ATP-binding protein